MASPKNKGNLQSRWYPQADQLKDPATTQRTMKQVLDQLYTLQDQHAELQKSHAELQSKVTASGTTEVNGPANTKLLGLNVAPVDTNSLANGATLKYNKATGNFSFQ